MISKSNIFQSIQFDFYAKINSFKSNFIGRHYQVHSGKSKVGDALGSGIAVVWPESLLKSRMIYIQSLQHM